MTKNKLAAFLLTGIFLFATATTAQAKKDTSDIKVKRNFLDYTLGIVKSAAVGVEYRVKAGIAVGGTSPLPLPAEIRKIEGFKAGLNLFIEGEVLKSFNDTWGLSVGLKVETKGMETDARVKNYSMAMVPKDGNGKISGFFTGKVNTEVNNSYISLPVLGVWKPSERWGVKLGAYGSLAVKRSFTGSAYDGYLREGTPVGPYVEIGADKPALYDFSKDVRRWYWGLQTGAEWRAFPHLIVSMDLTWGMNSIFGKDFDVITFKMFPIYGALSFGYAF